VDGRPIVQLPSKTIRLKELEFTEEERAVYDAYHKQGRELVAR
jgi:hypothetical protein